MSRVHTVVLALALLSLAGCAAKKHLPPAEQFDEATSSFRGGALKLAVDQFRELLDQHPFSEYNEEAELRVAHAQFLNEDYAEAVVSLTDFQRRYPTSPHLPFVGYLLGMCYARQRGTIDRDQSSAQSAQAYFATVAQQYPTSPFAELARAEMTRCREDLAAHELYVAKFYANRGNERAAEVRLITMASRYGDTEGAAEGLLRLATLYKERDENENVVLAYRAVTELPGPTSSGPKGQVRQARRALESLGTGAVGSAAGGGDSLDVLLASIGRTRGETATETVQVPGLEASRSARRGPPGAPAIVPPLGGDPYGRGGFGRPF